MDEHMRAGDWQPIGEGSCWVIDGDCPWCGERHLATNGLAVWCFSTQCNPPVAQASEPAPQSGESGK